MQAWEAAVPLLTADEACDLVLSVNEDGEQTTTQQMVRITVYVPAASDVRVMLMSPHWGEPPITGAPAGGHPRKFGFP